MNETKFDLREKKLKNEIDAYDQNIDEYLTALQAESLWLFIAVMGCWSINSNTNIQLFAFIITVLFFFIKVYENLTHKRTFNSFESRIEYLIDKEFKSGPTKASYLKKLHELQKKRASYILPIIKAPMFFLCVIFLGWSLYDQVYLIIVG